MAVMRRRESRWPFPGLTDWLEAPMPGWARVGPVMRIEDFVAEGRYVVRAELPGVDPGKDVDVHVGNGMLTISAERSEETKGRHRSEFRYGSFARTVRLPRGADEDDVTASYKNGVLEVSVGLAEGKATGRKITVESGG
jgi:HSP20 family protein